VNLICNKLYWNIIYGIVFFCVLIVFSLCRELLKLIPVDEPLILRWFCHRVDVDCVVRNVPLILAGRVFETNHIILSGQGIDIILGLNWMKWHKVVLDISVRLVHLNSSMYGKVTLHLSVISRIKASLHHMVERKIEEIHVV
jgi:hypothetical protein